MRQTNIVSNFVNLGIIQASNLLLAILIIPIVTRTVGIFEFGIISFSARFSQLAGGLVNYGTGQSGIKDTAQSINDPKKMGYVFCNALTIRCIAFILYILILFTLHWFAFDFYWAIVLSIPMVLAEVFNPLCFFIGVEKIRVYNVYNLIANAVCIIVLWLFIKSPAQAAWVNFILGTANLITYLGLLLHFKAKYKLHFHLPLRNELASIARNNFYLTMNNASGALQQSVIIFALGWGNSPFLGAYTLCDRIIGQCRNLLNTFGTAIYPRAIHVYRQSTAQWAVYRRKLKYIMSGLFFIAGVLIFIFADNIANLLLKEHNASTVYILKIMAFVPVISSFNVFNVLGLLLTDKNVYLFRISVSLFAISAILAFTVARSGSLILTGGFTVATEACAWLMYEYAISLTIKKNA